MTTEGTNNLMTIKQLRYYSSLIIFCCIFGACTKSALGSGPATIVGRWQAQLLQGTDDVLEFAADGTMKWTLGDGKEIAGAYRVAGNDLQVALEMYGDVKRATYSIVSLTDSELILQSQSSWNRTSIVYIRTQGDNPECKRLIIGRWKSSDGEVADFNADGSMRITGSDSIQHSCVYGIFDNTLEFVVGVNKGNRNITKLTIVSLTDTDLYLVRPFTNKKSVFRRAN
jgi:uncharacterized protein (TIGR03066 family)